MSALSELLNSQPVSARQAADQAAERGIPGLPYGTIAAYWSGKHGKPSAAKLDALAKVLPTVTLEALQRAAWNTTAPAGKYVPPEEANLLSESQRRALDALIKSIVETRGATDDRSTDHTSTQASSEGTPVPASKDQKTVAGSAPHVASSTLDSGQASELAEPLRNATDLTRNAHPDGPDRWPDGEPVYDEHWEQWKAWKSAGAPAGAWEAFKAVEVQQAYDLAQRFIEGMTDAERLHNAQNHDAEAPDVAPGDDPA